MTVTPIADRAPVTDNTVLVLVDVLNEFLEEGSTFDCPTGRAMVPALQELIATCRAAGIPIVYAIESHRPGMVDRGPTAAMLPHGDRIHLIGTPDVEVYAPLAPLAEDIIVTKRRHSAFYGTELEIILRRLNTDTIIVAGVTAPICCESTVRDAAFRDLQVIYPANLNECNDLVAPDGGSVTREDVLKVVSAIIGFLYGRVTTSDALVREIASRAGGNTADSRLG
jgi:nicotinamidase-related amidase